MTSPFQTPDANGIQPDSSAPYPILIQPSGAVAGFSVVQVFANGPVLVPNGLSAAVPGTGITIPAVDFDRGIAAWFSLDIYSPLHTAGISIHGSGRMIRDFGAPIEWAIESYAVLEVNNPDISDFTRATVSGFAQDFIPAGETLECFLDAVNFGTANMTVDMNSAYMALLTPA